MAYMYTIASRKGRTGTPRTHRKVFGTLSPRLGPKFQEGFQDRQRRGSLSPFSADSPLLDEKKISSRKTSCKCDIYL